METSLNMKSCNEASYGGSAGLHMHGQQFAAGLKGQGQGRLHSLNNAIGQDRDPWSHRYR